MQRAPWGLCNGHSPACMQAIQLSNEQALHAWTGRQSSPGCLNQGQLPEMGQRPPGPMPELGNGMQRAKAASISGIKRSTCHRRHWGASHTATLCPPAHMQTGPGLSCPRRWHLWQLGTVCVACRHAVRPLQPALPEGAPDCVHEGAQYVAMPMQQARFGSSRHIYVDGHSTDCREPADPVCSSSIRA